VPGLINSNMRRFAWFDCVRFLAIALVMVAHSGYPADTLPGIWSTVCQRVENLGWTGVDLFFVLSGFLVSGLLFDEHDATGTLDIRRFLIRRAFKIVPAFYLLVLVTLIYELAMGLKFNGTHLVHDLLFLQSYRVGEWPHAWTLAVEVHFYILLALLLGWLSTSKRSDWLKRLPGILCGVLVVVLVARLVNSGVRTANFNLHRELEPTHLHLDVLAAGVLLRYLFIYHRGALAFLERGRLFWIVLGLLLVYPSALLGLSGHANAGWHEPPFWLVALIPTLNYLGFGLIVFQAATLPFPTGAGRWFVAPFDYLGKHSYSIYLWHLPLMMWLVVPLVPVRGPLNFAFFFVVSLAVGTLLSEALEMPVLHLRNRLFPSTLSSARRKSSAATVTA